MKINDLEITVLKKEIELPKIEEEKEPEVIVVRDIRREAICLMLGISMDSDDDTILRYAKAWGESHG